MMKQESSCPKGSWSKGCIKLWLPGEKGTRLKRKLQVTSPSQSSSTAPPSSSINHPLTNHVVFGILLIVCGKVMLKRACLGIKTAADLCVGGRRHPSLDCLSSGRALLGAGLVFGLCKSHLQLTSSSLHCAESLTHPGGDAGLPSWAAGFCGFFFFSLCFLTCYERKGKQSPGVDGGVNGVQMTEKKGFVYLTLALLLRTPLQRESRERHCG